MTNGLKSSSFGEIAELPEYPSSAKSSPSIETCHAEKAMRNGVVPRTMLPRMPAEVVGGKHTFREQVFLMINYTGTIPISLKLVIKCFDIPRIPTYHYIIFHVMEPPFFIMVNQLHKCPGLPW